MGASNTPIDPEQQKKLKELEGRLRAAKSVEERLQIMQSYLEGKSGEPSASRPSDTEISGASEGASGLHATSEASSHHADWLIPDPETDRLHRESSKSDLSTPPSSSSTPNYPRSTSKGSGCGSVLFAVLGCGLMVWLLADHLGFL